MSSMPVPLDRLLAEAKKKWDAMSDEEKQAQIKAQAQSWARAEASWPKPRFKYVNGVKVYGSYEDYCNG